MASNSNNPSDAPVKTRESMAGEFCISPRTLTRWLKRDKVKIPPGNLSPMSQRVIYEKYGKPEKQHQVSRNR